MATLGGLLREGRQNKKLSLEEVSRSTKISVRMLEALEADALDKLPSETHARAFVRAYGDLVGLQAEAVAEFEKYYHASDPPIPVIQPSNPVRGITVKAPSLRWPRLKRPRRRVAVALAFLGLAGMWFIFRPQAPLDVPEQADAAMEAMPPATPSAPAGDAPSVATLPIDPGEKLFLEMVAVDRVWVRVKSDNLLLFEGTLHPGERETWEARREYVLRIGNSGGIRMALNGVVLPGVGQAGEVRTVILNHEGIVKVRE